MALDGKVTLVEKEKNIMHVRKLIKTAGRVSAAGEPLRDPKSSDMTQKKLECFEDKNRTNDPMVLKSTESEVKQRREPNTCSRRNAKTSCLICHYWGRISLWSSAVKRSCMCGNRVVDGFRYHRRRRLSDVLKVIRSDAPFIPIYALSLFSYLHRTAPAVLSWCCLS